MSDMKDRIKDIRKEAGLTQAEFSEMLGLSEQACKFYEGGYRTPKGSTVNLICDRFHINRKWLLTGEGEMHVAGRPQVSPERENEIAQIVGKMYLDDDGFRTKLIKAIAGLTDDELRCVKDFAESLVREQEK